MIRRFSAIAILLTTLFAPALPALAQEENPLANAVLLPVATAWVMVGLALLLMFLLFLRTRQGPN